MIKTISLAEVNYIKEKMPFYYLLDILSLGDPLISYFDSWVAQTLQQIGRVQAHQICDFVSICLGNEDIVNWYISNCYLNLQYTTKVSDEYHSYMKVMQLALTFSAVSLSLLLSLLLLELHVAKVHDGTSQFIDTILLFLGKAQHIKSFLLTKYIVLYVVWWIEKY